MTHDHKHVKEILITVTQFHTVHVEAWEFTALKVLEVA